ncbi:MAG: gas vesicle protein GvpG [Gaiellaceae bacterium]|jgi:hypothetical protein
MGLITGLLTLPLAPVRGTIWIAERLVEQAEHELGDETTIRRELAAAELRYESGALSLEEFEQLEDVLLDRLEWIRESADLEGQA